MDSEKMETMVQLTSVVHQSRKRKRSSDSVVKVLHDANKKIKVKIEKSNERATEAEERVDMLETQTSCMICLENTVEILCLPCMHLVTCETCVERITDGKCIKCRQDVTTTKKVYFP